MDNNNLARVLLDFARFQTTLLVSFSVSFFGRKKLHKFGLCTTGKCHGGSDSDVQIFFQVHNKKEYCKVHFLLLHNITRYIYNEHMPMAILISHKADYPK